MDAANQQHDTPLPESEKDPKVKHRWSLAREAGGWGVSSGRPCPICQGDSNCTVAREGAVLCRRMGKAESKAKDLVTSKLYDQRTFQAGAATSDGGRMWIPLDDQGRPIEAPVVSAEELDRVRAIEAGRRRAKLRRALTMYAEASGGDPKSVEGVNHPWLHSWMRTRGFEPTWLFGDGSSAGLPPSVRFHDQAVVWWLKDRDDSADKPLGEGNNWGVSTKWRERAPAMIAAVHNPNRRGREGGKGQVFCGVHATYLRQDEKTGAVVITPAPVR